MSSAFQLTRLMKASARIHQKPSSSIFPVFVQMRRRSNCSSIFVFGDERFTGVDGASVPAPVLGSPLLVPGSELGLGVCTGGTPTGSGFGGTGMVTGDTPPSGGVSPHPRNTA